MLGRRSNLLKFPDKNILNNTSRSKLLFPRFHFSFPATRRQIHSKTIKPELSLAAWKTRFRLYQQCWRKCYYRWVFFNYKITDFSHDFLHRKISWFKIFFLPSNVFPFISSQSIKLHIILKICEFSTAFTIPSTDRTAQHVSNAFRAKLKSLSILSKSLLLHTFSPNAAKLSEARSLRWNERVFH